MVMKATPARNILFGLAGGFVSYAILKAFAHFGYQPTGDLANYALQLPWAVGVALAHGWDVWTGDNKVTAADSKS